MTKSTITKLALACALTLGSSYAAVAQSDDNALVDALVKKKILTAKEGEDIRADLIKENPTSTADKINIGNSVTRLDLYGDIRLRYQYENNDPQVSPQPTYYLHDGVKVPTAGQKTVGYPTHGNQQSRVRFRLRLNADFQLAGGFFGGVQLQTNTASDSANQTYTGGFQNYAINISRAFIGWHNDFLTVIGGKQANPFYTTDLVWDPDINPDGFTETLDIMKLFSGSGPAEQPVAGYSKDGKSVATTSVTTDENPFGLKLVSGQFIFDDNYEGITGSGSNKSDAWLFVNQLVASYKFNPDLKLTFAPGYLTYNSATLNSDVANGQSTPFYNGPTNLAPAATRDLNIITGPGDVSFKVFGMKAKVLWDVAYNFNGSQRDYQVYQLNGTPTFTTLTTNTGSGNTASGLDNTLPVLTSTPSGKDKLAWLAGFQLGENKKAGDWSVFANYRQVGIAAVDPNLSDSDFAQGQLNVQGIKTGAAYNITDFAVFAVTYFNASNLRTNLYGGQATGGNAIANTNASQTLQVDLTVKF